MRIPADAIAENRCNSRKKEIRPRSVCFEHMIEEARDALELSHQVRKDLKELSRFWTFRSFEEIHAASLFYDFLGAGMDEVIKRLELLEHSVFKEDYGTIAGENWPIYDLVNYYDRLIDLLRKAQSEKKGEDLDMISVEKWRRTAGLYAQVVCHLEDR
jgi:hypothetical protein